MSIGQNMQEGRNKAFKSLIYLAGIIVYITAVIYAEVHGYTLLKEGIDPGMLIWATIGIFALGITALALPLGLHFAFFDAQQRLSAFIFYGLDLALLMLNAVIDYLRFNAGGTPPWGQMYLEYIVPLNPVIAGLGWSILLLMDPHQKQRIAIETLTSATQHTLNEAIAEAAKAQDMSDQVNEAAAELADSIITATLRAALGSAPRQLPASSTATKRPVLDAKPTDKSRKIWRIFQPRKRPANGVQAEAAEVKENGAGANPTNQQPG